MTPAELAFWQRVQRRAAQLEPEIASAVLRAFATLRENMNERQLAEFVASGAVDRVLSEVLSPEQLDRAFLPVRDRIRQGMGQSIQYFLRDLPSAAQPVGKLAMGFDILNPDVITAIRSLEAHVITNLSDGIRETVRAYVENGLRDGTSPTTVARGLRSVIGLAPNQAEAVRNLRAELEAGQYGAAGTRALIDARYNLKALDTLSAADRAARIDAIVGKYEQAFTAFNAETNARTAALQAMKEGNRLSRMEGITRGVLDGARQMKRWVGVKDARERPEHLAMEGETVPFDQPYSNGEMVPGDSTYNCFPGDTVVEGAFVGGLKAAYSGPIRELETARGHRLRLTPNHPVLTPDGWVAASHLREGSALLSNRRSIRTGGAHGDHVDDQDGIATAEQVFDALAARGTSTTRTIGRLDLHGDGRFAQPQVDVVGADVQLRDGAGDALLDCSDQRPLDSPDVDQAAAPRRGAAHLHVNAIPLPAPSRVGGPDLPHHGGAVALDGGPLQHLRLGSAANWHTALAEASKQDDAAVPAFLRELEQASAGDILPDQVVKIRDFHATTHVYDLQTVTGWMIAQGIVISNCRCVSIYFTAPD